MRKRFFVLVVPLLASCASAPVGSPTKYALERGAKAASLPEVRESTEELRFGLLCSGYFCSEKYQLSGKGLIPIVGGFYPDKPNTVKLFSKKRPYKHLIWLKSFSDPQDSDVIVFLDGDHSDFPEDLPALLAPIERGEADLVIGSRMMGQAQPGSLAPQQRFGNWLACRLIALRFGRRFSDLGPFRAIRRSALEPLALRDRGFGWNVEMQLKALKARLRIVEVPVRYRPRVGQSKISGTMLGSVRAALGILGMVARHW